jgi:starch phosphorylase
MKAVQTYTVVSHLPDELAPLREVAMNLGWMSDERARDLFRRIDRDTWDHVGPDPVGMLLRLSQERLAELAADASFVALATSVRDELVRSLDTPRWFQVNHEGRLSSVGYFAAEYGIAASLPQYSGGLGVLAGDHLRAANDLGLPLTAVGLFYHHGYFRQELDRYGWQQERFPRLHPGTLALEAVPDVRVTIDLAGSAVQAGLWMAHVGRIPLYLLDTDIDVNADADRLVTDRLYGGGVETRIRQEILLGIGGVRALTELGVAPEVFHINEGHAGFLALERIRRAIVEDGLTFDEAREAIRPAGLFTTHTPVPAGIDRFPRDLIERYFASWCRECGLSLDDLMALGHEPGTPTGEVFNLAVMSLNLAGASNGVSLLHGGVSRRLFGGLWPDLPDDDVPIGSVTNGVHARTWTSRAMTDLLDREIGSDWPEADESRWRVFEEVPDRDVWSVRTANREHLVGFVRRRLRRSLLSRGHTASEVAWTDAALDPTVLTIGFARRFASYKRATLLLSDRDRLKRLLLDEDRPVQFVIAGKAHPEDQIGKGILQEIVDFATELDVRHRFVFVPDYEINAGRVLYAGVDVWLNNPRRPLEACGTSGMKAAYNGVLNCSVLDGWWDELYEPDVGWAIPSAEWEEDEAHRDALEAGELFKLLETQVVPLFYRRDANGLPAEWLVKVKAAVARLGPAVESTRMLREYVERYYEPMAVRSEHLRADHDTRARHLVRWKRKVALAWPEVSVTSVTEGGGARELGQPLEVSATIDLGPLGPADVEVQLLHGAVDLDDELRSVTPTPMTHAGAVDGSPLQRYIGTLAPDTAGEFGYTVRVIPAHEDLTSFAELGLIAFPAAL